jgi:VanZ family protein
MLPLRRWRFAFLLCLAVVLVLALLPPRVLIPSTLWDKANHFLAFVTLAVLGLRSYPARARPVLWALLAYGALIEVLQALTGYRSAEWLDLLADGVGLTAGWQLMSWLRRWRGP